MKNNKSFIPFLNPKEGSTSSIKKKEKLNLKSSFLQFLLKRKFNK